ncbi:hypothetical protein DENSPDRAFT_682095 [Dentipellis sp. KUC8613]|nr:hypothetical protein DENSPDRAFT_682095 [Dentipellis sp. KUC8613]
MTRTSTRKITYARRANAALSELSRRREYGFNPIPLHAFESRVQSQAKKGLGRLGPRWATCSKRHLRLLAQHRYITYNNDTPEPTITVHMKLRKPSRAARKRVHDMPGPEDEDDEERERRENRLLAEELGFGHKQRLPRYAEVCELSDRRGKELKKLQKSLGMQVNPSLMSIVDDEEDRESAVDTDFSDDELQELEQEQEQVAIDGDIHEDGDEINDDPFVDVRARSHSPAFMTRASSVPATLPSHSPTRLNHPTLALAPTRKPTLAEAAYATPVSAPRRHQTVLASPESPSARSSRGGPGALSYASGTGTGLASHANLGGSSSRDVGDELPTTTATSAIFPAPGTRASLYASAQVHVALGGGSMTQASLGAPGPSHARMTGEMGVGTLAPSPTHVDVGLDATPRARTAGQSRAAGSMDEDVDMDVDVDATPRPVRTQRVLHVDQSVGSERDFIRPIHDGTEPVQTVEPPVQKSPDLEKLVLDLRAANEEMRRELQADYQKEVERLRAANNTHNPNSDQQVSQLQGRFEQAQQEMTRLQQENARLQKEKEGLVAAEAGAKQTLSLVKNVVSGGINWASVQALASTMTGMLSSFRS